MSAADSERFEEDFDFVFARTGKARAPRGAQSARRPGAAGMRSALLGATQRRSPVMVKITSFGKSAKHVAEHLDYISREGTNAVFDSFGSRIDALAERAGLTPREALQRYGRAALCAQAGAGGERRGRPRERVTMNLMLSMPEGTDTGAFELATRDFLRAQFGAHEYAYTFHDDRAHYHAHVAVGLQGADGRWLNPRKADLREWRERFAESLERRGIAADATPAYSRGNRKDGYRRDLEETRRRGTRRRPERSPGYDAETEARAIQRRADAWMRIAEHYAGSGDREAAEAIRAFLADRYDVYPQTPAVGKADAAVRLPPMPIRDSERER